MSKLRALAAVVLFCLATTVSAVPRVPPDDGPSIVQRIRKIVIRIVHALDDPPEVKLSPPIG